MAKVKKHFALGWAEGVPTVALFGPFDSTILAKNKAQDLNHPETGYVTLEVTMVKDPKRLPRVTRGA